MAKDKKEKESKVILERTYNVPLRKEWLKTPRYKRAKKAVKALKEFLIKHMKSNEVKLGKYVNLEIWKHGIKNPPHHVKVNVTKDDKGLVKAEFVGAPVEKKEEPKKKKLFKKEAPKTEEKKETPKSEEKKTEVSKKDEPEKKKINRKERRKT